MVKNRKKPSGKSKSRHHIIPKSRGGKRTLENMVGLTVQKHRAYHLIFDNKTPDEIVTHLAENYWNGQWDWVRLAYDTKIEYLYAKREDGESLTKEERGILQNSKYGK